MLARTCVIPRVDLSFPAIGPRQPDCSAAQRTHLVRITEECPHPDGLWLREPSRDTHNHFSHALATRSFAGRFPVGI